MINGYKIVYCVKKIAWFLKRDTSLSREAGNEWELGSKDSENWYYIYISAVFQITEFINKGKIPHTYGIATESEFITIKL